MTRPLFLCALTIMAAGALQVNERACKTCRGNGWVDCDICRGTVKNSAAKVRCGIKGGKRSVCEGSGWQPCMVCAASGLVKCWTCKGAGRYQIREGMMQSCVTCQGRKSAPCQRCRDLFLCRFCGAIREHAIKGKCEFCEIGEAVQIENREPCSVCFGRGWYMTRGDCTACVKGRTLCPTCGGGVDITDGQP
jgi:hypothetical protein